MAENLKLDVNMFMNIGIGSKMIRKNKLNKVTIKKVKAEFTNYQNNKIYKTSKSYKAKFFLVAVMK